MIYLSNIDIAINFEKLVEIWIHKYDIKLNVYLFVQNVPYADAMNKTLVFAIFDFDRFSKHDQIGEVKVPLCQVDLAQTIEEWRELQSVEGEGGQVRLQTQHQYKQTNRYLNLKTFCINVYLSIFFKHLCLSIEPKLAQVLQISLAFITSCTKTTMQAMILFPPTNNLWDFVASTRLLYGRNVCITYFNEDKILRSITTLDHKIGW